MTIQIDYDAVKKVAAEAIIQRVKKVRCPEHGKYAVIVPNGNDFEVSGCCEKLINSVRAEFKK